jgi:predicted ATP-grasp superfamily ATP-dependent carboligase
MTSDAARVLVVSDGETPHVLAAVRSLARGGFEVAVGAPADSLRGEASSRYARRCHDIPRAEDGIDAYLAAVAGAVGEAGYAVVLPGDDADLLALSWGRDRLGATFPYPRHDLVVRAVDKLELVHAADRAGLAAPHTEIADEAALAGWEGPVVVKARLHWRPDSVAADRHLEAVVCADPRTAADAAAAMRTRGGEPLLQQCIDGRLMAVSMVLAEGGQVLAVAQQSSSRLSLRRTSVRARTVPVDAELVDRVRQMLVDLGWHGIANVQLLRSADGAAHVIDLNGRFYGSLALAVRAGADLPVVWVRDALGLPAAPVQRSRPGVRFHAFEEDLRRARSERRGGAVVDIARVFGSVPAAAHTTWSPADPKPALRRLGGVLRSAKTRLASRQVR